MAGAMPNLFDSASNLRAALLRRDFSARDLLAATLDAIARLNPVLNAIVYLDVASAFQAASASHERIARGEARVLEGLPITLKDCFDVAGMPATAGAPALRNYVPENDAPIVARLRRAGANIIGKTNVPIFTGDFQTYNNIYGTTNNPWNSSFSPGGSVATGISVLDIGSDMAGSIRWPAHCCGIFGLKTSWDLVSAYGHIPPLPEMRLQRNPELLTIGPLTRSAADLSLALDVIAGPRDPLVPAPALPSPRRNSPKGMRVALWLTEAFAPVDAAVGDAVRMAALMLEEAGAIVDEIARPAFSFEEAFEVAAVLTHALVGAGLPEKVRQRLAKSEHQFLISDLSHRALQLRGLNLSTPDLTSLWGRQQRLREDWARFFEKIDVVLCPPAPVGAIPHDHGPDLYARSILVNGTHRPYYDLMLWACLATGAGLPPQVWRIAQPLPARRCSKRSACALRHLQLGPSSALCGKWFKQGTLTSLVALEARTAREYLQVAPAWQ